MLPGNPVLPGDPGRFDGAVADVQTARLRLHAIDVAEGERIVARSPGPDDSWASDFPFEGDIRAAGAFLHATSARGEQRPFGYYRITRPEAVLALLAVATDHGLSRVVADTTVDNVASQRTLLRVGFRLVDAGDELHHYEALLDAALQSG